MLQSLHAPPNWRGFDDHRVCDDPSTVPLRLWRDDLNSVDLGGRRLVADVGLMADLDKVRATTEPWA